MNKILVLGAHTDDIEFSCGATIAKFIESGNEIYYSTFSFANKSLREGFEENITKKEVMQATKLFGIPEQNLFLLDYEVRIFPKFRQEILENLIDLRNRLKPNLVLTHNSSDMHQDHKTIYEESFRAFKETCSIWGYEAFKNNRSFRNDIYSIISTSQLDKKIEAMTQFKSQLIKFDFREAVRCLAAVRGADLQQKYAECFEAIRLIA